MTSGRPILTFAACLLGAACASAGSIDTAFFEGPWPKPWVHTYEVGKQQVHWRQRASDRDGLFAGAVFGTATPAEQTWTLAVRMPERSGRHDTPENPG